MAELAMSRSASTISFTRSCSEVFCGFQPSLLLALVGLPSSRSTYTQWNVLRPCSEVSCGFQPWGCFKKLINAW